jgi:hypothetical protein
MGSSIAEARGVQSKRRYSDRMLDRRNRQVRKTGSPKASSWSWVLPQTADGSHGMSNLATQPRAGNISSDTRAG